MTNQFLLVELDETVVCIALDRVAEIAPFEDGGTQWIAVDGEPKSKYKTNKPIYLVSAAEAVVICNERLRVMQ